MKIDGAKAKELREKMPMSAEGFAALIGVSSQTIHRIEREGTGRPKTLAMYAAGLDIPLKKLV